MLEEDYAWDAQLPAADQDIRIQQEAEISMMLNPMIDMEILGKGTFPGGEKIEIEQDIEMSLTLDSANGEEMVEQDTLALEPQAQSQDVKREICKEKQVTILVEGAETKPTIGEQNRNALESIEH